MSPFPEDVRRFLDSNIESVDQLEVLRVLGEDRDREWSAGALAAEIQADTVAVRAAFVALRGRGLLATDTRGTDVVAKYGPSSAAADALSHLLELYRERPVTMIKMVYERAKDPLRSLADAFRLRKEG